MKSINVLWIDCEYFECTVTVNLFTVFVVSDIDLVVVLC